LYQMSSGEAHTSEHIGTYDDLGTFDRISDILYQS
jgi:hypothetical protein